MKMEKTTKYILIVIIAILAFSSLITINFWILPNLEEINTPNGDREKLSEVYNITLKVDYSGEKPNDFFTNINLTNYKTTVYHALVNCCSVQERWYGDRVFIERINGVGIGWVYYVNDDFPGIPCNNFNLRNNDTILWKHV